MEINTENHRRFTETSKWGYEVYFTMQVAGSDAYTYVSNS